MGEIKNLKEWCSELSLKYTTIHACVFRNGWAFDRAFEKV